MITPDIPVFHSPHAVESTLRDSGKESSLTGDRGATGPLLQETRKGQAAGKERNFRSPPARRRSGIRFCNEWASLGCPSGRAGGSSKRSRQEAPEEMIVSPPQAGSPARCGQGSAKDGSSQEGPRTDGWWRNGLELACQGKREKQVQDRNRGLEAEALFGAQRIRSGGEDQDRRSRTVR